MIIELSYEELRKMLVQERHSSALEALDELFFDSYEQLLKQREEALKASFSIDSARALENFRKVFDDLKRQRLNKLLFKSLRDCELNSLSSEGLVAQEKELYNELTRLLSEYLSAKIVKAEPALLRTRVVSPVSSFVGFDGSNYGPFNPGDSVELPREVALLLSKRGAVELV